MATVETEIELTTQLDESGRTPNQQVSYEAGHISLGTQELRTFNNLHERMRLVNCQRIFKNMPGLLSRGGWLLDFGNRDRFRPFETVKIVKSLRARESNDHAHSDSLLQRYKTTAIGHGKTVFQFAATWVLIMLEEGDESSLEKVRLFLDSLKWFCGGGKSVLIRPLLDLITKLDPKLVLDGELKAPLLVDDEHRDPLVLTMLQLAVRADILWEDDGLPHPKSPDDLSNLLKYLVLCGKMAKQLTTFDLGRDKHHVPSIQESPAFHNLLSNIDEIWTGIANLDQPIPVNMLMPLLNSPMHCETIEQLYHKVGVAQAKRVHGLELKIAAIYQEGNRDVLSDQNNMLSSFRDCLTVSPYSHDLQLLKTRAITHAKHLFWNAVYLKHLMSSRGQLDKFKLLVQILDWASHDEITTVITRLLKLLDSILNDKEQPSKLKAAKKANRRKQNSDSDSDTLLLEIAKLIFRSELLWTRKGIADSDMDFVSTLAAEMDKCESCLLNIGLKDLKVPNCFLPGRQNAYRNSVSSMIDRLCEEIEKV